jgi:hypothetical protein
MLVEHKGLAVLFAVVSIAFMVYCLKPHAVVRAPPGAPPAAARAASPPVDPGASIRAHSAGPSTTEPIYIETLPEERAAH